MAHVVAATSAPNAAGAAAVPTATTMFWMLIAVPARARPEISAAAVNARPFQTIELTAALSSSG